MISMCFLQCILKGLHKAPRPDVMLQNKNISYHDIDVMVSPMGCWGKPHMACEKWGIPIIVVKENTTVLHERMGDDCIYVNNYLEAAGVIKAMEIGVTIESLKNEVYKTKIINKEEYYG